MSDLVDGGAGVYEELIWQRLKHFQVVDPLAMRLGGRDFRFSALQHFAWNVKQDAKIGTGNQPGKQTSQPKT
jgi:hypothetical protein